MRAATIRDRELRFELHPDPVPGDHDLLVRVRAAGVNAADLIQLRGAYPAPPGSPPDIPGLELAGEVVQVGAQVRSHRAGDRVMALVGGGGQAELALVPDGSAMTVPDGLPWAAAGGFPEVFCTAFDALFTQASLQVGERVLVTGAAGGVGTAAVQLAVAAGAEVVASVRSEALRIPVLRLGAHQALEPAAALEQGPFDVALELVGGPSLPDVLASMGSGGRIAVIGTGAGRSAALDLGLLMARRARLFGSTLRARSLAEKAMVAQRVERQVVPLLATGRLQVPVMETYRLDQAADAYRRHAEGGKLGKLVLVAMSDQHPTP